MRCNRHDGITDLTPQRARDERTGAEVYNDGRDAIGDEADEPASPEPR